MKKSRDPKDIGQPEVVSGILTMLGKLGMKEAEPRIINKAIEAADLIIAELRRDRVDATVGMGLAAWLASDDTGMSSKFMAHVMFGSHCKHTDEKPHPHDPSDFGRCFRFLLAVPEARAKLSMMSAHGRVWAEYVARWDEMETLYAKERPTGKAPKLYAIMKQIQDTPTPATPVTETEA